MTNGMKWERPKALVLGANGGIGGEMMRKLLTRGWAVTALDRRRSGVDADGVVRVLGDAMSPADVLAAARGVSVIVHAVNPPGYRNWGRLVLPMLDATIAAARAVGARVVLPGTVYNYGPDAAPAIAEEAPQHPKTRKGAIRVEMERRLEAAARDGVPVIVLRCGDYFGPRSGNNWFSQGLIRPGTPVATITDPGMVGVAHQWAYLPDVAETMMRLIEASDRLAAFTRCHFEGHVDGDGTQMIAAIRRVVGNPGIRVKRFPWWLIRSLSPVVGLFGELAEMRYLWRHEYRLTNRRLLDLLDEEPHTPLDEAIRATLIGQGCLAAEDEPALSRRPTTSRLGAA